MSAYPSSSDSGLRLSHGSPIVPPPGGQPPQTPGQDGTHWFSPSVGLLAAVASECPLAVFLLDANLRILFTNREAERLVARADGLASVAGLLRLGGEEALEMRIRRALGGDRDAREALGRAFYLESPSGRRPYELTLRIPPQAGINLDTAPSAVGFLFVRDPEEGVEVSVMALRRRFGLTTSEAKTALAVVAGGGVQQVCEVLGLRPMTVRGYLRQVFDKTGAHSQAELVRLVLCGTSRLPYDADVSAGTKRKP